MKVRSRERQGVATVAVQIVISFYSMTSSSSLKGRGYLLFFLFMFPLTHRYAQYMFEDKHYYIFKEQISLNNMSSGNLEGSSNGTARAARISSF